MKHKGLLSLAAAIQLVWNPTANTAPNAAAINNQSVVGESRGQLRVFTPDRKRWVPYWEDYVWENQKYRVYREDGSNARTGYHRQLLSLDAGTYFVRLVDCSTSLARVVIEPGRVTEITMTN